MPRRNGLEYGPTWTPSMGRTTKFIEREQDDSTHVRTADRALRYNFGSSCATLDTEEKHMDFAFHFHMGSCSRIRRRAPCCQVLMADPIFHCGATSEALQRLPVQRRPQLQFRGCQVEPPSQHRPQPCTGPTQLLAVVSLDGSGSLMNWKGLHCLFATFCDFLGTKQQ